jgi:hypothetical protein
LREKGTENGDEEEGREEERMRSLGEHRASNFDTIRQPDTNTTQN